MDLKLVRTISELERIELEQMLYDHMTIPTGKYPEPTTLNLLALIIVGGLVGFILGFLIAKCT